MAIGRTKLANIVAQEDDEASNDGAWEDVGGPGGGLGDGSEGPGCGGGRNGETGETSGGGSGGSGSGGRCLAFVGDSGQGDELVARCN